MSQDVASTESKKGKKGNNFLRAMLDLIILALLVVGSGFGGYFWGIHQQLAPIAKVGPGTPGVLPPAAAIAPISPEPAKKGDAGQAAAATDKTSGSSAKPAATSEEGASGGESKPKSTKKFWIASSGVDYIGYSITVKVNGTAVDSFFGPGKTIDITRLVKAGENSLECDAKEMGDQYNKHGGDVGSKLTLQLVSGPHVSDSFKKSDVLVSYQRTAADSEDDNQTLQFSGD